MPWSNVPWRMGGSSQLRISWFETRSWGSEAESMSRAWEIGRATSQTTSFLSRLNPKHCGQTIIMDFQISEYRGQEKKGVFSLKKTTSSEERWWSWKTKAVVKRGFVVNSVHGNRDLCTVFSCQDPRRIFTPLDGFVYVVIFITKIFCAYLLSRCSWPTNPPANRSFCYFNNLLTYQIANFAIH